MNPREARTALLAARALAAAGAALAWLAAGLGAWLGNWDPCLACVPMAVVCAVAASIGLDLEPQR